ncbi:heme response regulator HssR [Paenibacillus mucilaginosus K02]|nr:heme response regulator HssR [Paenibacillus mucilaginosus K02]
MCLVLLLLNNPATRRTMKALLEKEGHKAVERGSLEEAVEMAGVYRGAPIDLILVDIRLLSVESNCEDLRGIGEIPIMVTGSGDDMIQGFLLGADDFVAEPVAPAEFLLRMRAVLRRYQKTASDTLVFANVVLNRKNQEVRIDNKSVILPQKEFELLFKLARHPKQTLTRIQLIEQIWGPEYEGDYRTVDVHIKRLRYRFSGVTDSFRIVTQWGNGYKLEIDSSLQRKTKI